MLRTEKGSQDTQNSESHCRESSISEHQHGYSYDHFKVVTVDASWIPTDARLRRRAALSLQRGFKDQREKKHSSVSCTSKLVGICLSVRAL